ncbi:hypothetical protein B0H17DRAFT_1212380 [Mycena rosella]|uniref:Uncharacterized protein n=1 Tax=Mycena rosella TaxID=1033263 RepID=A0AAD7G324_MYCRO|nr:hypothetical protein B0H17DRAFT_1212380 [Mycena rosella]
MEHLNWEGTLQAIQEKGKKPGIDWLKDKQSTHFALEAICWERSFIPWAIWKAGDSTTNLIESVHSDANREGVHCTLLGGLQKGQAFDSLKIRTLELQENFGIRPTYLSGHVSENAFTNLRRRDNAQRRALLAQDQQIVKFNNKIQSSYDALTRARERIAHKIQSNYANYDISEAVQKLLHTADKALEAHLKVVADGEELRGKGTGKIAILSFNLGD